MFVTIPLSMIAGFLLGYWCKAWRDAAREVLIDTLRKDVADAHKMGYHFNNKSNTFTVKKED
jgi:hypothetical protein